eukprot:2265837-Pyramimonas_sp.AAC.1
MDRGAVMEPLWIGFVLSSLLFLSRAVQSFTDHQYAFSAKIVGLHLRTALQTAVYAKTMRCSHATRQQYSTGDMMVSPSLLCVIKS